MSAQEFQKRIADLKFSADQYVAQLKREQKDFEAAYEEWKSWKAEHEDEENPSDEPEYVDHETKIAAIETAIEHLNAAVDELDGALDES